VLPLAVVLAACGADRAPSDPTSIVETAPPPAAPPPAPAASAPAAATLDAAGTQTQLTLDPELTAPAADPSAASSLPPEQTQPLAVPTTARWPEMPGEPMSTSELLIEA
jgi:hypothetical protein